MFEKVPTVRLDPRLAREYGLTPTRILKLSGVYTPQYDVPFLGYVDETRTHVRINVFNHGPVNVPVAYVSGLNRTHREEPEKPKPKPRDDKQIDLEDWLSAKGES